MENFQENPSKLAGACRACLSPLEDAKCLLDDEALVIRFQAVARLEIIINDQFPSYLCSDCEEKTNEAYKFQEICKQSDEFVRTVLGLTGTTEVVYFETKTKAKNHKKIKNEKTDDSFITCKICHKVYASEKFLERHMVTHNNHQEKKRIKINKKPKLKSESETDFDEPDYIKIEKESSDDGYQPETRKKPKAKLSKVSNYKFGPPRIKLKQFAKENVDSIIEGVKSRLDSKQTCHFCDFSALNFRSLSHHMTMAHKEYKTTWCGMCNLNVDNLEEHNVCHMKDLECPFCQKLLKSNTHFIEHVMRHAAAATFKCHICKITFENQEILKEHTFEAHPRQDARFEKEMRLKQRLKIGLSRGARVAQYSQEQVEAVIKKAQVKMNAGADCPICSFNAVNTRALSTHMSIVHRKEKPKYCNVCHCISENLRIHKETAHAHDFDCPFCGKNCKCVAKFVEHVLRHSDEKSKWCYFCNKMNIENLKEHKELMHSRAYACDFCGKNHKNVTNYVEHLMRHSESKNYHCTSCKKSFISEKYLEKHKKLHDEVQSLVEDVNSSDDDRKLSDLIAKKGDNNVENIEGNDNVDILGAVKVEIGESKEVDTSIIVEKLPEKSKFCKECNRTVQNLKRHVKKYHTPSAPEPPSLCPQCGKMFKSRGKLNIHLRLHSGVQPYKCQFCPKAFLMNSHLKLHIRTHTKEKPYICQVCAKSFAQTSMLSTHMRIHTGRPHQCNICQQRFCRPSELRIHMRKHTGEKPYVCDQCGRGFKQTSHLVDHRRTHFDERPYQCSFCDKAFKNVATLKAHEFIHTGTKPFKCSKCPFTCRVSYHLTKHMMTHDSDRPMLDKPYSCEVCTKNFQTKAHLFSHFDRYHNSSQNQQMEEVVITETIPEDEKLGTDVTFYA